MTQPFSQPATGAWFVDSSAFFAAAVPRDSNHATAAAILQRIRQDRIVLVTTPFIVAETHALFLARAGRDSGVAFLKGMDSSGIRSVWPTVEDEAAARAIIYRYEDKEFSLTDALSFAVMDRLHMSTAFTFDRDFERYGFQEADP